MDLKWYGATIGIGTAILALAACFDRPQATTPLSRCAQLASRNQIDSSCALDAAKDEIRRRQGKLDYSKFKTRFDDHEQLWVVEAIHEPEVPGGFVVVAIGPDGRVAQYENGL